VLRGAGFTESRCIWLSLAVQGTHTNWANDTGGHGVTIARADNDGSNVHESQRFLLVSPRLAA
jgi:hypothetical protein